jgi:hypothetical protein
MVSAAGSPAKGVPYRLTPIHSPGSLDLPRPMQPVLGFGANRIWVDKTPAIALPLGAPLPAITRNLVETRSGKRQDPPAAHAAAKCQKRTSTTELLRCLPVFDCTQLLRAPAPAAAEALAFWGF